MPAAYAAVAKWIIYTKRRAEKATDITVAIIISGKISWKNPKLNLWSEALNYSQNNNFSHSLIVKFISLFSVSFLTTHCSRGGKTNSFQFFNSSVFQFVPLFCLKIWTWVQWMTCFYWCCRTTMTITFCA